MRQAIVLSALLAAASAQDFFECPDEFEGYYPHDLSCDRYWECKEGVASLETCGNGLAFDDLDPTYTTKNCDYLYNVECGNRTEIEPPIAAGPNCPRLYGTFPDEDDCTAFYNCRDGLANRFSCAPGLAYDIESRVCKWADQVTRCKAQNEEGAEEEVFVCPNNVPVGIFSKHPHPEDCRQYFVCIAGTAREYGCPLGTVFKIGGDEFDGKCSDPEDVPECANYYGDLDFDKQELVKAGVDPEAVGVKVAPAERVRVNRPAPRRPSVAVVEEVEEEDEEEIVPLPPRRPATRTNTNSFRSRPSRPQPTPAPASVAPPRPAAPSRNRVSLPQPVNSVPRASSPSTPAPTQPPRVEVPAVPLTTATLPVAPAGSAQPGNLGQPAKVKAGEDYYYYYYYYDEDDDKQISDVDTVSA